MPTMYESSQEEEQQDSPDSTITGQIKGVVRDAIDYLGSTLNLLQARFVELTLSSAVFLALLAVAILFALAALILLNIALGIWLTQIVGNVVWSLVILGGLYSILSWAIVASGLRWLRKLRS
jgi:hypothetical protein